MNKVKAHLKKHRVRYIVAAATVGGIAVGFATAAIIRKSQDTTVSASNVALLQWKPVAFAKAVVVPQGHPGYVIQNNETGEIFMSQNQAAKAFGINSGTLSSHLNGKFDTAGGHTFTRLGVATSTDV